MVVAVVLPPDVSVLLLLPLPVPVPPLSLVGDAGAVANAAMDANSCMASVTALTSPADMCKQIQLGQLQPGHQHLHVQGQSLQATR